MSDETETGRGRWREKFTPRKDDLQLLNVARPAAQDKMTGQQLRADALAHGFVLDDSQQVSYERIEI